ncbi:MAG TPA: response regulator transcription factor [Anaerolineales bacterium]|nr:response regulator transcription factor [Anaerolineales bacterium]HMZ06450.1 response regulator transcription factor [Anaerolineales bacterium]HNA88128.1 response regulator transcription factor [Anaerolineales bacterium]HNB35710.1 response regulator transcription factor [Anaerolineales bacterium]HNC90349.1 response regulator transcription factor [Anaerolineales bacterium]
MPASNILVIEDDTLVARTIERCLRGSEYHVQVVNTGVAGLKAARKKIPDLVLLDVMMPGMDGYTVCKEMREDALLKDVPVIFLTAKNKVEDKIVGLSVGADDYLGKPFNVDELLLRVKAILRRTNPSGSRAVKSEKGLAGVVDTKTSQVTQTAPDPVIRIGEYSLDTRTYMFSSPKKGKLRLTPIQYTLLYHLMTHPNKIFSPALLLDEVWDYPSDTGSADLVRVHIKNIREAVEEDPKNPVFIKTVQGYGYTIQTEE